MLLENRCARHACAQGSGTKATDQTNVACSARTYLGLGLIWPDAGWLHVCSCASNAGARVSTWDSGPFSPAEAPDEASSSSLRMPSRLAAASPPLRFPPPSPACIWEDERCKLQGWAGLGVCLAAGGVLLQANSASSSTTCARPCKCTRSTSVLACIAAARSCPKARASGWMMGPANGPSQLQFHHKWQQVRQTARSQGFRMDVGDKATPDAPSFLWPGFRLGAPMATASVVLFCENALFERDSKSPCDTGWQCCFLAGCQARGMPTLQSCLAVDDCCSQAMKGWVRTRPAAENAKHTGTPIRPVTRVPQHCPLATAINCQHLPQRRHAAGLAASQKATFPCTLLHDAIDRLAVKDARCLHEIGRDM